MKFTYDNLLSSADADPTTERITVLLATADVRVERIVSAGQKSPPGSWFDQDWDEWVVVLSGGAILQFEGETQPRTLRPGDYVAIPAHLRHRVEWTAPDQPTIWLAVHSRPVS